MEPLGFFGIFKATTRTLLNNWKHFLCLSALVLLPIITLVFAVAPKPDYAQDLSALSSRISDLFNSSTLNHTHRALPFDGNDPALPPQQPASSRLLTVVNFIYALFVTFVSLPPLTVSSCRGYLNQHLNVRASLNAILKSFRGLVLTFVCIVGAFFAVIVATLILCVFIGLVFTVLKVNVAIPLILVVITGVAGSIYLVIVWSLAFTVTILEEKWGWDALQRSAYLLEGRKGLAFFLKLFFLVSVSVAQIYVSKGTSLPARLGIAAFDVVFRAFVHLYRFSTTVILYMSCKKYHNEPVEDLPGAMQGNDEHTFSKYEGLEPISEDAASLTTMEV